MSAIFNLLVEAHNVSDVVSFEIFNVVVRAEHWVSVLDFAHLMRAGKSEELTGNDPVEVAIFNTLQAMESLQCSIW